MCAFHSASGCALWKFTVQSPFRYPNTKITSKASAATGIGHVITIAKDTKAAWEDEVDQRVLGKGS